MLLTLAVTLASPAATQASAGPMLEVTGGTVEGQPMGELGGAVFKGIPYAAPPVGDLRWREPLPVAAWTGVVKAQAYRPGCGQGTNGKDNQPEAIEDCLYLNVWTSEWPKGAKKPVMLWVNGGELAGASGALRPGSESLTRHGVVLVSANYRGTLLGMMGHPALTAESPHHSAANYGLHDEVAVLRWIHANIAKFGGDPDNVTVFGQSGGGHAISMLLSSPLTKGLIHRAIIDSGVPMQAVRPYLTKAQLEQIGIVAADLLKAPKDDPIRYLRSLPATAFMPLGPQVRTQLLRTTGQAWDEGTDGYVLPRPTNEVWQAHQELPIPLMVGSTGLDSFAAIAGETPQSAEALAASVPSREVKAWEERILKVFYEHDPDLAEQAAKAYGLRGEANHVSTYAPYGTAQQQIGVDLNHRCATGMTAAMHSAVAPTWQWEFTRTTPGHLPTHGSELRYVFGIDDLEDAAARRQADLIQTYWTNFAKTGNPNGQGVPHWAAYDLKTKVSLELAQDGPIERRNNRAQACAPYVAKYTRHPRLLSTGDQLRIRGIGGAN